METLHEPLFWVLYLADAFYILSLAGYLFKKNGISAAALAVGLGFQTWFQISLGTLMGVFMANTMVSLEIFMPWCIGMWILLHLLITRDETRRTVNSGVVLLVLFAVLFTLHFHVVHAKNSVIHAPAPTHPMGWVVGFFSAESLAYAAFFLAAWYAFAFIRGREKAGFYNSYVIICFVIFSISQVLGAVWCYLGWAVPFHLSSDRHFISAAFWLFCALYLHLRFLPGWNARRKAIVVSLCFFPVFYFRYVPYFISYLAK